MAKRKPDEPKKGAPEWQSTFSDLMNLLLCFFVLLFAMSSVDASKWEEVVTSMTSAFSIFSDGSTSIGNGNLVGVGTSQLSSLDEYYSTYGQSSVEDGDEDKSSSDGHEQNIVNQDGPDHQGGQQSGTPSSGNPGQGPSGTTSTEATDTEAGTSGSTEQTSPSQTLEDMLMQAGKEETAEMLDAISEMAEQYNIYGDIGLDMDNSGKYIQITLSGAVLFNSGSAVLKTESYPLLAKVGDIINVYYDHSVNIIGHTDNVPLKSGKYENNEMLSSARAISMAKYLVDYKNIDIDRLSWTGRGEYEPVASNATAEGRALNRRVEIRIYNSLNSN